MPANVEGEGSVINIPAFFFALVFFCCSFSVLPQLFLLNNEELHDLYSPNNIVRVIKSRRMRWAGQVARIGRRDAV
jgi:hypothetical protein